MIAKSRRRPTLADDGVHLNNDMISGDMDMRQLISLNPNFSTNIQYLGVSELVSEWKVLNYLATINDEEMRKIANEMTDIFITNNSIFREYSSNRINALASNHNSTKLLINRIKQSLEFELKKNPNFVYEKGELKYVVLNGSEYEYDSKRWDIPTPIYSDKTNGLAIVINDTWAQDVKVIKFIQDKVQRKYTIELDFTIYDHYGLNTDDIDPGKKLLFANLKGFLAWFMLQHYEGFSKKPFITVIKFKKSIDGKY